MEVFEAIRKRRSIRKYKPEPVSEEKLKIILEAARLAPSGKNRQPWQFVVVRNPERKKAVGRAANNQMFITDAGVIIAALGDPAASPNGFKRDPVIAVEHMVLAAASLGYGTCWIGAFDEKKVKRILGIPEKLAVIALLPIGVPDESPPKKPRKELAEMFFQEEYGKPLDA
ncbi:MAG: nitroreductase family protein [Thermoproteota archaeon]|nr:nitroreductase family protein [Thermoproteota archaeon]